MLASSERATHQIKHTERAVPRSSGGAVWATIAASRPWVIPMLESPQRDADRRAPVAAERQHDIGEDRHQQPPLQQFAVAMLSESLPNG